jgi:hypothetical protein
MRLSNPKADDASLRSAIPGAFTNRGNPPPRYAANKGESIGVGDGTAVAHPAFLPLAVNATAVNAPSPHEYNIVNQECHRTGIAGFGEFKGQLQALTAITLNVQGLLLPVGAPRA